MGLSAAPSAARFLFYWRASASRRSIAAADDAPPVAVTARLVDEGEGARLAFDFSGPVEARARPITDPDRIIVDFPEVNFQIDPSVGRVVAPRAGALVKAFRFGLFGPGKSRVVIELGRPACPVKVSTHAIAKGVAASRLVVELKRCEPDVFAERARLAAPPPVVAAPEAPASPAPAGPPVIVLDPGHGGVDGGALGVDGVVEKAIVYDFALELRRKLEATGTLQGRDDERKRRVTSRSRTASKIAREANASLFISIHAEL